MTYVLELDGVWKGYRDLSHGPRTLRGTVVGGEARRRRSRKDLRWALRGVSFALEAGESLGIVGRNGAGKSTLLRLASHLGRPTRGRIAVDPDAASVLNLGASFDLLLTGRENAYTAALVAGLTARAARRVVGAALDFAELEDFAEAPVRTYSEGMKLRLAFGVVASLRPRLLVLDEVLAVGDVGFRAKCHTHIAEMREAGTSLLLASHATDEVLDTCRRAVWLDRGAVRAFGDASEVVERYENATRVESLARTPVGLPEDRIGSLEVELDGMALNGRPLGGALELRSGAPLEALFRLRGPGDLVRDSLVVLTMRRDRDGVVALDVSTEGIGSALPIDREPVLRLQIDRLELAPGEYHVDVGIFAPEWEYAYDYRSSAATVSIGGAGAGKGVLAPPARWTLLGDD